MAIIGMILFVAVLILPEIITVNNKSSDAVQVLLTIGFGKRGKTWHALSQIHSYSEMYIEVPPHSIKRNYIWWGRIISVDGHVADNKGNTLENGKWHAKKPAAIIITEDKNCTLLPGSVRGIFIGLFLVWCIVLGLYK